MFFFETRCIINFWLPKTFYKRHVTLADGPFCCSQGMYTMCCHIITALSFCDGKSIVRQCHPCLAWHGSSPYHNFVKAACLCRSCLL